MLNHVDGSPCPREGYPHRQDELDFLTRIPESIDAERAQIDRGRLRGVTPGTIAAHERMIRWFEAERRRIIARYGAEPHTCPLCGHACPTDADSRPSEQRETPSDARPAFMDTDDGPPRPLISLPVAEQIREIESWIAEDQALLERGRIEGRHPKTIRNRELRIKRREAWIERLRRDAGSRPSH